MGSRYGTLLLVAGLLVGSPCPVPAQFFSHFLDHALCFKVTDAMTKAFYSIDVEGDPPPPPFLRCQVKVPAKLFCVATDKMHVNPDPPGAPLGPEATPRLCYKVTCPRAALPTLTPTDQFGTHALTLRSARLLCTPVATSPAPPFGCCELVGDLAQCGYYNEADCALNAGRYAPYGICDGATGFCRTPPGSAGNCCDLGGGACIGGPNAAITCSSIPSATFHSNQRCALGGMTSSCLP